MNLKVPSGAFSHESVENFYPVSDETLQISYVSVQEITRICLIPSKHYPQSRHSFVLQEDWQNNVLNICGIKAKVNILSPKCASSHPDYWIPVDIWWPNELSIMLNHISWTHFSLSLPHLCLCLQFFLISPCFPSSPFSCILAVLFYNRWGTLMLLDLDSLAHTHRGMHARRHNKC